MNTRPYQATLAAATQRRQAAGEDLEEALLILRKALKKNSGLLDSAAPDIVQRSSHAIAQCAGVLTRIVEALSLDQRLTELELKFNGTLERTGY